MFDDLVPIDSYHKMSMVHKETTNYTDAYADACHATANLAISRPERPSIIPITYLRRLTDGSKTNLSKYNRTKRSRSDNVGRLNEINSSKRSCMAQSNCSGVFDANTNIKRLDCSPVRYRKAFNAERKCSLKVSEALLRRKASASSTNNKRPRRDVVAQLNNLCMAVTPSRPIGATSPPDMIA
ncbi:hypothetical protein DERF_010012 [Dermatophagoides farinae]|uniref:Uncharacterized protein n=1 Tax=Dermatophagoides farinae TaxID=6954 RepID=A0A922I0C7_DERFA|nr:hypothetical protein DERF_010012 [Dermatophagoides farinae]